MTSLPSLLAALDEQWIARNIEAPHDQARLAFRLRDNVVADTRQFEHILGEYYNHHHTRCMGGHPLPPHEAIGHAKHLIESAYRRRQRTLLNAVADAKDGTNGGMRTILDTIADELKFQSLERYITEVFDRHVEMDSWPQRVELVRQFMAYHGHALPEAVRSQPPERYAQDYKQLIRAFVETSRHLASNFRRM